MADINPDDIPFVMDKSVAITDKDGKPSTPMLDWFQALWNWMKQSVVDLTTKITTLEFDVDGVSAAIVEEATIRQTEDGVLASQITTVAASVDDATANGQIYFAAKAAPSGATAAYGVFLTAGNYYGGLEIIATSGGGSAIGMTANQFKFVDAGTQFVPFSYDGGNFYFNTNVIFESVTGSGATVMSGGNIKIYYPGGAPCVFIGNDI